MRTKDLKPGMVVMLKGGRKALVVKPKVPQDWIRSWVAEHMPIFETWHETVLLAVPSRYQRFCPWTSDYWHARRVYPRSIVETYDAHRKRFGLEPRS